VEEEVSPQPTKRPLTKRPKKRAAEESSPPVAKKRRSGSDLDELSVDEESSSDESMKSCYFSPSVRVFTHPDPLSVRVVHGVDARVPCAKCMRRSPSQYAASVKAVSRVARHIRNEHQGDRDCIKLQILKLEISLLPAGDDKSRLWREMLRANAMNRIEGVYIYNLMALKEGTGKYMKYTHM
jgi:hypothetical protein